MADDDELAEQQAAGNAPAGAPVVPLTEYSPEAERLDRIVDVLREYVSFEIGKATKKRPKSVKPSPRPVTAAQRAARRRKFQKHVSLSRRLLGDRSMYREVDDDGVHRR